MHLIKLLYNPRDFKCRVWHHVVLSSVCKYRWLDPNSMHIGKNFSSWWVMLCPFQLNRSTQFPVNAVQSLLFEEAIKRVNCVPLTPFRVKVNLCLNISKMSKVKSKAFFYKAISFHKCCLNLIGKDEVFHGLLLNK